MPFQCQNIPLTRHWHWKGTGTGLGTVSGTGIFDDPVLEQEKVLELDEDGEEINYRTSQQFEFQDWSAAYQEKEEVASNSSSEVEGDLFKEHSLEYDQEHEDRQG